MAEQAIQDPAASEVIKRLSLAEQDAKKKIESLELEIATLKKELNASSVFPDSPVQDLPCFDPYRRPDGRIITSSVIKKTDEWYEESYLFPHEPLRRDLIEVDYLLHFHVRPNEPWKLVNLFHWYKVRFLPMIHIHHDAEEKIVFPMLNKKIKIPEKTSADHKVLMKLLKDISDIGEQFYESGGNENNIEASTKFLPLLTAKWNEMFVAMLPHLAEEEEQMVTIIKDAFTQKEFDKLIKKIVKAEGPAGSRKMLPSIMESLHLWGTDKTHKEFMKQLPPPVRFLLRRYWSYGYAKYHRGVLNSLRHGAPKQVIKEKSWF